jgi:pimeloyl-ACP methyl ester carboxylesterase
MDGPTSHFWFSQRLRLHYVDWGNEGAPPLLMIHGGRDHCRNWDWVAARLRDRYHIIAPDLRGHGDSAWSVGGNYDLPGHVYDIAQLVHQWGQGPISIICHSLGAAIGLAYTGAFPDTVTKLVAIEGLGPPAELAEKIDRPVDVRMREWVAVRRESAGRAPRRYARIEDAVARMMEENPHLSPEQARHLTIHGAHQNEDGTYSWKFDNQARNSRAPGVDGFSQDDIRYLWSCITCPVLLVRGAESWASDPVVDGGIKHFRNARLVNFERAGHWVHHDRLDGFVAETESFLAE